MASFGFVDCAVASLKAWNTSAASLEVDPFIRKSAKRFLVSLAAAKIPSYRATTTFVSKCRSLKIVHHENKIQPEFQVATQRHNFFIIKLVEFLATEVGYRRRFRQLKAARES